MYLVLLLGSRGVTDYKSWDSLRMSFFAKYKDTILTWCGYDAVNLQNGRFEVEDENALLCLFALLKQYKLLGEYSYEQIAGILYANFNFTNKINTICTKLKTVYQEHIYEAVIQDLIKGLKNL